MRNIPVKSLEEIADDKSFASIAEIMGFASNSLRTMAHRPEILEAFSRLNVAIFSNGTIPLQLKYLIGYVTSGINVCRYCQAHSVYLAKECGVGEDKIRNAFAPCDCSLFTPAEVAALEFTAKAASISTEVTPGDFDEVKQFYNHPQIIEIICVVGLYAFLNRWNDTLGTELENVPASFAAKMIGDKGWNLGKHGPVET